MGQRGKRAGGEGTKEVYEKKRCQERQDVTAEQFTQKQGGGCKREGLTQLFKHMPGEQHNSP